jgi:2-oxoglutarate dehydrogenase E2 component (dihydrolipoamide succinyltransferase)
VNLADVEGTGPGGRITKEDLLAYVERPKTAPPAPARPAPSVSAAPAAAPGELRTRSEIVPMSPMRKKIAERMVLSRHTAAHVSTVFQVDFSKVVAAYKEHKDRFERQESTKLSYTPFFVRAAIDALKRFPILNSSVSGENIVYKKDIHMGIAVALEWGLIVPVIAHADEKSFLGLTRAINDLAERARTKKLSVSDVEGGTFTITNPGPYGSLFATPIINPPQVGIMGVGAVYKAPVVINDAIAVRSIVHLTLSYDHRLVDGAVADQFMASVRNYLEHWEEDLFA